MSRDESPYVLWRCRMCGQEVLSHRGRSPSKFRWTDGHVCLFEAVKDNGGGLRADFPATFYRVGKSKRVLGPPRASFFADYK